MKSGLYQKYISKEIDPKIKTEKLQEVNLGTIKNKRVNWSDNPIPEGDKIKHPDFKKAQTNIDIYSNMKDPKKRLQYFKDNVEGPAIRYKDRTYSLQALIPD